MMLCNDKFENLFRDFLRLIRNRQIIDHKRTLPRMRNLTTTPITRYQIRLKLLCNLSNIMQKRCHS